MSSEFGERIRVLIIDDIPETRENLRKLLSFDTDISIIGAAASGLEGIELAREFQPHVVLMDINMPDMDGITATEVILQDLPAAQVVMLSVQGETEYMRRAMLAGARDFLTKPPTGDELMSTIHRVYEMGKSRAALIAPPSAAVPTATQPEGPGDRQGKVIAVFSPKGGVGCTTVAVNLAVALQQVMGSGKRVALMDANLQFGDVGVMLDLQPSRSIADLLPERDELDRDMLNSVMMAHGSGIKVLLAPPNPEAAEGLLAGASRDRGGADGNLILREILGYMSQEFDIVVVDLWSWLDDITLTVFDVASLIVLVVMPDIPSIKSARLFLEMTTKLNYPVEEIALVVNGMDPGRRISAEQIEQAMIPVVAQIPLDERVVLAAANHGMPFVLRDPSRPVSKGVAQLAEFVQGYLAQAQEAEEAQKEAAAAASTHRRLRRALR